MKRYLAGFGNCGTESADPAGSHSNAGSLLSILPKNREMWRDNPLTNCVAYNPALC